MVYTVTCNPALDYVMHAESFATGAITRAERTELLFGGKGINVSLILRELSVDSVAMGFLAGFTGNALEQGITARGIGTDFIHLSSGLTRINVKIRSGVETDINGEGPTVLPEDVEALYKKLDAVGRGDVLVLAGSIPPTLPSELYEQIMERLFGRGARIAVDAAGELLLRTLKYKPFLIKPNREELAELFGVLVKSKEDALRYAEQLQVMGARNVLVSMGGEGAVLLDEHGGRHTARAFSGAVRNTVGAGDSMVAGFLAGYLQSGDYGYALRLGSAAGSATAFSDGLATKNEILDLMNK